MNILHLLAGGDTGGIEVLCKDYAGLSKHNNIFLLYWASGKIAEEMNNIGYDIVEMNASNKRVIKYLIEILKLCKKRNIDAVIVHHAAPLLRIFSVIIHMIYPQIKIYSYAHSNAVDMCTNKRGISKLKKAIIKYTLNHSNKVIAISESVKKSLTDLFSIPEKKIEVIYNGVDLEKFKYNNDVQNGIFTILYLGRLFEKKGVDLLIKASSLLKIPFKCYIVGAGQAEESLKRLSQKLDMEENIEFVGMQRNVESWHHKADIFVHPAIWEEGFGIALVEAMASGLPCVAFRKGAIPEIIDDNKNGFIVDDTTPEALAEKINYIYNIRKNNIEWASIRENAVNKAKRFSIERMVNSLDDLIVSDGI